MQTNYTNAIRYLILKEIKENGYRNLNKFIPAQVTEDYFDYNFSSMKNTNTNINTTKEISSPIDIPNKEISISKDSIDEVPITIIPSANGNKNESENSNKIAELNIEIPSCFNNID
jgi:hypothetical protein